MNENERIVCEFLRKISPSREWIYLDEIERYWINELCNELNKQFKDENTIKLRELVHAYKQKENDMNNKVLAVFDIYDENLNGDLRDHLIGICDSLSEAKTQIEKMNLDNFRWLGTGRGKFSENGRDHMIIIDDFVMNEIFV